MRDLSLVTYWRGIGEAHLSLLNRSYHGDLELKVRNAGKWCGISVK